MKTQKLLNYYIKYFIFFVYPYFIYIKMKKDKKRNRLKKRQKDQWRISWSSSNIRYLIIF